MSKLSPTLTLLSVALIAVAFAVGVAGATATTDDTWSRAAANRRRSRRTSRTSRRWRSTRICRASRRQASTTRSTWRRATTAATRRARSRPASACPASTSPTRRRDSWAQPMYTGWTRATVPGRRRDAAGEPARQLRSAGRADRDAAALLRERPGGGRRSGGRLRPAARRAGPLRVDERLAALLREPRRELQRRAVGADVQGLRGDRRVAPRQPELRGGESRNQQRVEGAGDRVEAERGALLRPRDGLRSTTRRTVRSSATSTSATPRSGARRRPVSRRRSRSTARPTAATRGRTRQLSEAAANNKVGGRQDCAVDTDSAGNVYVFWDGFDSKSGSDAIFMVRSSDGGKTFERPREGRDADRHDGPARSRAGRPLLRRRRGRARRVVPDDLDRERRAVRHQRE